jgi:hypothetical protein
MGSIVPRRAFSRKRALADGAGVAYIKPNFEGDTK